MGDEKVIALLLMQQIAVLFLIMGLGFLIVKLGIVKTEDSRVLSMVTIYLVLPLRDDPCFFRLNIPQR